MKQVLIEKNDNIKDLVGSQIVLSTSREVLSQVAGQGITTANFPLNINVMSGDGVTIRFELAKELASKGVLLLGAYHEGKQVVAMFMSASATVSIEEGTPALIGTLLETVRYRQITNAILGEAKAKSVDGTLHVEKCRRKRR